ncbi:hypothetical protein F4801DRAFT_559359 [Xylaria longipes]|nr:hypothetical protein F4801DRAFT_559359 [Xylaria longipes]
MASHDEANTSVTVTPLHSNDRSSGSMTDTLSSKATHEVDDPENNLTEDRARAEAKGQRAAELASVVKTNPPNLLVTVETAELIVPVGDAITAKANDAQNEDANASAQEENSSKTTPAEEKRVITVQHYEGEFFKLPWDLCQTREGMENLIKVTYEDEMAKNEIDNGKYEIHTMDGDRIIRDWWDMLVQPGWRVVIRLDSQKGSDDGLSSDSASDSDHQSEVSQRESKGKGDNFETLYIPKVTYTVSYHSAIGPYRTEGPLIRSFSYDNAVVLARSYSNAEEISVLEEKVSVIVSEVRDHQEYGKSTLAHKPKLFAGDMVGKKSLRIHSPFLLNTLRSIIKYSSSIPSVRNWYCGLEHGEFPYPYMDLFHHKRDLLSSKNDTTGPRANHTSEYNAICDGHIDLLLEYLENEPVVQHKLSEDRWAKKTPTTTFAGFWLLMKPGSDVYIREGGQLNAYVVDSVSGGVHSEPRSTSDRVGSYIVRVWNLTYDGKLIRRQAKAIEIPMFDNERDILSLPVFPARFQDNKDGGARKQQLIDRGKKVFRFAKCPTFLEYTGLGLTPGWKKYNRARVIIEHESQPWNRIGFTGPDDSKDSWPRGMPLAMDPRGPEERRERLELDPMYTWYLGKMQIDIGEGARSPRCECSVCKNIDTAGERYRPVSFSDYDKINPKDTSELSEHQYMLCMSHMFGFILKDRTYDLLDVGCLSDVKIVGNAIDKLVMRPEANKDTIKAIVKTYVDNGQPGVFSADFIQGKGEGQIFLLHGPPGTGKTLTAESVAEYTRRPLLCITAADLGHEPIELEKNLLRFFTDAQNWDAIVLLDEADVYLERRSTNDLRRNSIVSIFLRAMDYFQGILFLTTNRVGHFDEAFISRIHVSIGYERLDEKARGQIWENLFRKLKENHKNGGPEIRYEYEAKEYVKKSEEVKKLQWNGREIRNAFQTAVALATFEANTAKQKGISDERRIPEVKESHLTQVVNMSAAFKDYIIATHEGLDDVDMAYKLGIRHDTTKTN